MTHHTVRGLSFSAFAMAACGLAQAQVTYTLTNLGTLGGAPSGSVPYSYAAAINNAGQIVGGSYTPARAQHAFLYQNGTMSDLATTYGNSVFQAEDINASGQIVGSEFIISGGIRTTTTGFFPNSVNASGFMAGSDGGFPSHATTYLNGAITDLGTFGGSASVAYGVNTSGKVVGYANTSDNNPKAFLYTGGSKLNLGTLGGNQSIAFDINDSDQIVGNARNSSGFNHAFLYQNGVMSDLGTLDGRANTQSAANAINASGQIVGYSNNFNTSRQTAFLYDNGVMLDLDVLVGGSALAAAGFQSLTFALDINDFGQIVGYGRPVGGDTSTQQAFLITISGTAIPEPASAATLAGLGVLGLVAGRRRARR